MSGGFFVDGRGISLETLRRRVCEHLGSAVAIEPSTYKGIEGYFLSATRPQTVESPKDFVRNSGAISLGNNKDNSTVVATKEHRRYDSSIEENEEDDQSTPTVKSRTLSGIRRSLSLYFQKPCLAFRKHMPFRKYVGPERKTAPHNDTVVWNLIFLVMFFTSLCLAARFPSNEVRVAFVSISGVIFIALSASVSIDLANHGNRRYIRNLGNTTLTVLLSIPLMTALYSFVWYPRLNQRLQGVSQDIVTEVRFPAVALFQRLDWSAQAHILPVTYAKCFLGWLDATGASPMCTDLPRQALAPGQACNCSEDWSSRVVEDFVWQNTAYRYLSFNPSPALIACTPTYIMTLQVFFNYNATFSLKTSSQEQTPSLYMAVHDPSLGMVEALQRGYSRMVLISANGDSSINLGLQYRREMSSTAPAYDYALGISTVPNLNLVCNTASRDSYPCHITLFLQMPTFDRTTVTESAVMDWMDVAGSVGGWFSFVQALSWLISGQAGAT